MTLDHPRCLTVPPFSASLAFPLFPTSSSLYKAPWARVMVYGLGHKVRRNGQLNLMEAVCYPLDASPSNTGLTPPPTTNQYPTVIIPTDKVHIKLGKCLISLSPGLQ